MNESEVRKVFNQFKSQGEPPTFLHCFFDDEGNVAHAEIKRDQILLWSFPEGAKSRFGEQSFMQYGPQHKCFSLSRDKTNYQAMENQGVV